MRQEIRPPAVEAITADVQFGAHRPYTAAAIYGAKNQIERDFHPIGRTAKIGSIRQPVALLSEASRQRTAPVFLDWRPPIDPSHAQQLQELTKAIIATGITTAADIAAALNEKGFRTAENFEWTDKRFLSKIAKCGGLKAMRPPRPKRVRDSMPSDHAYVRKVVVEIIATGITTVSGIRSALNGRKVPTFRGIQGGWHHTPLKRFLIREKLLTEYRVRTAPKPPPEMIVAAIEQIRTDIGKWSSSVIAAELARRGIPTLSNLPGSKWQATSVMAIARRYGLIKTEAAPTAA